MTFNPSKWRGFFAPFRIPFTVTGPPDHTPDELPQVALVMNEFWYPYVQGAVKALARPETYSGDIDDVKEWVQAGIDLCSDGPCPYPGGGGLSPDWYLSPQVDTWVDFSRTDGGQLGTDVFWSGSAFFRTIHVKLLRTSDDTPVGANIVECHVTSPSSTPNLSATFTRCDGTYEELTPASGTQYALIAMLGDETEWAEILINVDVWCYFYIRGEGNYTCEVE